MRFCSLRYPAYNAHAPYCRLWPAPLYNIFTPYIVNGTFLEKKKVYIKCVFRVSLQLLSKAFFILRRNDRGVIKNVYWFSHKLPFILVRFKWNLNFLDIFEKYWNFKFHENPSSGNLDVPCGRTDRHGMTGLTVAFRNSANAPKKVRIINIYLLQASKATFVLIAVL